MARCVILHSETGLLVARSSVLLVGTMTKKQYSSLKVGDKVKLLVDKPGYFDRLAPRRRGIVASGSIGVIGAVNVPNVTGREITFACVDFPCDWMGGRWQRVAARAEEMELVQA